MSQSGYDRRRQIAGLYDEAAAAMERGDWPTALADLDAVRLFDPGFPGLEWRSRETQRRLEIHRRYSTALELMYGERWLEASVLLRQVRREAGNYFLTEVLIGVSEQHRRSVHLPSPRSPWPMILAGRMPTVAAVTLAAGLALFMAAVPLELSGGPLVMLSPSAAAPTPFVALAQTLVPTVLPPVVTPEPNVAIESTTTATSETAVPVGSVGPTASVTDVSTGPVTPDSALPTEQGTPSPSSAATVVANNSPRTATPRPRPPSASPSGGAGVLGVPDTFVPPTATRTPTRPVSATPRVVQVVATDFQFEPGKLIFNAGESVRLTLSNNSAVDHDWVMLDATGRPVARVFAPARQSASLTFDVPPAGIYSYRCDIGDFAQRGMTGIATVR